jgi:hypothetical protein
VLSNGHAFGFDTALDVWLRLADDHFHESDFHSDLPAAVLGATNGQGQTDMTTDLAMVHAAASTVARTAAPTSAPVSRVATLMQSGGSGRKKRSVSHLESLLGSAVLLGRGVGGSAPTGAAQQEYKDWLRVYVRRLAEDGAVNAAAIDKVRELCEELLGPPSSRSPSAASATDTDGSSTGGAVALGTWAAKTELDLDKRALLAEVVLPTVAKHSRISSFQRLVSEYKLELETMGASG